MPTPSGASADLLFQRASREVLASCTSTCLRRCGPSPGSRTGREAILAGEDAEHGLRSGDFHDRSLSSCIHLAAGRAPSFAADARQFPLYAAADVKAVHTIRALREDGCTGRAGLLLDLPTTGEVWRRVLRSLGQAKP